MSQLKKKKALEEVLEKRLGASEQLQKVIRSIDQAKSDVEVSAILPQLMLFVLLGLMLCQIMETYQLSTSTLRSVLSHPTLDQEHITSTTDNLAEVLADQHEIDDAIRSGGAIATGAAGMEVDEDELADELQDLIKEEEATKTREEAAKRADMERLAQAAEERQQISQNPASQDANKEVERRAALLGLAPQGNDSPIAAPPTKDQAISRSTQIEAMETGKASASVDAQAEWQRRYEDAQQRQRDEKRRAEDERMKREAMRMPAE